MVKFESKIEQQVPSFMKSNVFILIPNCHSPVYHTQQTKPKMKEIKISWQELMVYHSTYHGFCRIFQKKGKSEISQLLLFILLIIISTDRFFFNSHIQGKNHTLHCREAALCRFTRASYFYRKHQNTSHSTCLNTVYNPLTSPDGLFVAEQRARKERNSTEAQTTVFVGPAARRCPR